MNSHEIVVRRNKFYQDMTHWQFVLMLVLMLGLGFNFYFYKNIKKHIYQPTYFMVDKGGTFLRDEPLENPIYSNEFIENWTLNNILFLLQLNYVSYTKILNLSSKFFNQVGYVRYIKALEQTNLARALTVHQYRATADVIEPLKVVEEKKSPAGRHMWVLKGKIMLSYTNAKNAANPFVQELNLEVTVLRESLYTYSDGISIFTVVA